MSFCFILNVMPLCLTLSHAFVMPRKILQISRPSSNDCYISGELESSWLIQESILDETQIEGTYLTKRFHSTSASTRRARRSDTTTFDQNKRIFLSTLL